MFVDVNVLARCDVLSTLSKVDFTLDVLGNRKTLTKHVSDPKNVSNTHPVIS